MVARFKLFDKVEDKKVEDKKGMVTPMVYKAKTVLPPGPQSFKFNYRKTLPSEEEMASLDIPAFLRR